MPKTKDLIKYKHPNSRKTNALIKQIKKTKSRAKVKQTGNIKLNFLGEKLLWFRDNLEPDCSFYTPEQAYDIIEKYLSRFNEELEQIRIKHSIGNRKNRQHASREDIINLTIKNESEEFKTCGLEIPDLLNATQFNLLKQWKGELRFIPNFKLKRFTPRFLESKFTQETIEEDTESTDSDTCPICGKSKSEISDDENQMTEEENTMSSFEENDMPVEESDCENDNENAENSPEVESDTQSHDSVEGPSESVMEVDLNNLK